MEKAEGAPEMDKDLEDNSDDNEKNIEHANSVSVDEEVQGEEPEECDTNTGVAGEASSAVPKGPPKNLGEVI